MINYDGPSIKVEVLDNIFIADNGNIKILLLKNESEPYKGYWCLPRKILLETETILEAADSAAHQYTGLSSVNFRVGKTFSRPDRILSQRVLGISTIGFTDSITISLKQEETPFECSWFDISSLPKMIYDHGTIAGEEIKSLKEILNNFEEMKKLFPSDFTLPELQKIYELISHEPLDRRNFRKKLLMLDVLEETGENNTGGSGRPARLYRFKEALENKKFF